MDQTSTPWLKRMAWRHPEWWLYAVSLFAWLAMVIRFDSNGVGVNGAHHHHHGVSTVTSFTGEIDGWMLMVVAMMLPLIAVSARNVAARSLWFRRQRAIVGFVVGYLSIWLAAGVVVSLTAVFLQSQPWFDPKMAVGLFFLLAVAWQGLPLKRRALVSCHRTQPVAPEGMQANWDCLRYGWMIGGSCLLSCWAWMVFCAASGHHLVAMLFATFVAVTERYPIRRVKGFIQPQSSQLAVSRQ